MDPDKEKIQKLHDELQAANYYKSALHEAVWLLEKMQFDSEGYGNKEKVIKLLNEEYEKAHKEVERIHDIIWPKKK